MPRSRRTTGKRYSALTSATRLPANVASAKPRSRLDERLLKSTRLVAGVLPPRRNVRPTVGSPFETPPDRRTATMWCGIAPGAYARMSAVIVVASASARDGRGAVVVDVISHDARAEYS